MEHNELLLITGVLAAGVVCQWIAWYAKIPAILPLLAAGLLAGPIAFGILEPQEQLGHLFFPFVSLSVAIILFEGSLTLNLRELRTTATVVRNLLTIGALITWLGSAAASHYFLNLRWGYALLFGAVVVVTGPTVIAPLLRNVRPSADVASILKWEGIIIDPLGALLAVLVFEFIVSEAASVENTFVSFLRIITIGSALGFTGGYIIYILLRRFLIPDYLRDVAILAMVTGVFAISNTFAEESGLLAVTVMGIFLANTDLKQLREIWYFKEKISILLISSLFILLAANINREMVALLDWRSLVVLAVIMFVLRPLSILFSTLKSSLSRNEKVFLSWIAPRGIVAAAVSSLFAFELFHLGYTDATILGPLTFLVIVGTVVLQGGTAKPLAKWLGVSEADPQGFLLMGGFELAHKLGLALQEEGFAVRLVDTNYENVSDARLAGLDAYHGNILSEYTETDLNLSDIGRFLALTRNDEANALACKHLEDEFGSSEVYQLVPRSSRPGSDQPSSFQLGRLLFGRDVTYHYIKTWLDEGAKIKKTPLTREFTYADFMQQYDNKFIPLMAIQGRSVVVATVDYPLEPQAGWTLVSLVR